MNSAPVCTPTEDFLDSRDDDVDVTLSAEYSDTAEDVLLDDTDVIGCDFVSDACEKLIHSDSEDGCDDLADNSPNHRLICECQHAESTALDLSRCGLKCFCHRLRMLSQLQVFYYSHYCDCHHTV